MEASNVDIKEIEAFRASVEKLDKLFVQAINLDKLDDNTILVFKVDESNMNLIMSLPHLCEKYEKILKEKNTGIIVIKQTEEVSALNEEQMAAMGWVRQNKV